MKRSLGLLGVPAIGGLLLAIALTTRGADAPVLRKAAPPRVSGSVAILDRDPGPEVPAVFPQPSTVRDSDLPFAALPEGDLQDTQARASRKDELREAYFKYRSAVACDDAVTEERLYPMLLLDRDASLEFAREEVTRAQTGLDYEIAQKTEEALKTRVASSERSE